MTINDVDYQAVIVGVSSASGPSGVQDALDDWCATGGIPEDEESLGASATKIQPELAK